MTDLSPETVERSWGEPIVINSGLRPAWISDTDKVDVQGLTKKWYSEGTGGLGVSASHIVWHGKPICVRLCPDHPYYAPAMVDPDLIEAREVVIATLDDGDWAGIWLQAVRTGLRDDEEPVRVALAGIKRGRALAAGDRS